MHLMIDSIDGAIAWPVPVIFYCSSGVFLSYTMAAPHACFYHANWLLLHCVSIANNGCSRLMFLSGLMAARLDCFYPKFWLLVLVVSIPGLG